VTFVALVFLFQSMGLQIASLPIAGSLSAIMLVVLLCFGVAKTVGGLDYRGIMTTLGKSLISSIGVAAVTCIVAFGPIAVRIQGSRLLTAVAVLFVFTVGGWAYYFIGKALGMPETAYVTRALNRFTRRA
jgi:peptidoglycan biosynthesis protein MviN/MurJ (putative lipid II flippase)